MYIGCPPNTRLGLQPVNQLGLAPAVIAAAPTVAKGAVAVLTGAVSAAAKVFDAFQSSDPVKDQERMARITDQYNSALAGSQSAADCLADMAKGVSSGPNDPRACAVGSTKAALFAKLKWNELRLRVAAGTIGGVLIRESNLPATAQATVLGVAPLVIGGVVLLLLMRRGR